MDAKPHSDPAEIKEILARQVTSPVQWETTMQVREKPLGLAEVEVVAVG